MMSGPMCFVRWKLIVNIDVMKIMIRPRMRVDVIISIDVYGSFSFVKNVVRGISVDAIALSVKNVIVSAVGMGFSFIELLWLLLLFRILRFRLRIRFCSR